MTKFVEPANSLDSMCNPDRVDSKFGMESLDPSQLAVAASLGRAGPKWRSAQKSCIGELVARCLWDVFSNEHDVIDRNGRLVHLGSWRGTAEFLARQLNRQTAKSQYDYMDFYMGSFAVRERADLTPVYEMIFRRLTGRLFDWRYSFPSLQLIEFPSDRPNAVRNHEFEKMQAELRQARRQAIEDSKLEPVPEIVLAYRNVLGIWPHGWPPWQFNQPDD